MNAEVTRLDHRRMGATSNLGSSADIAKLCHCDSQGAAMRIVPPIKMHNDFQGRYTVHRERLFEALSLDLALLSKNIVHFCRPDDPQRGRRRWLEVSAFHHTTGRSYQHLNCVNIAPTTYELSARGRIFDGLFERANHFDRDEFYESERLCHHLLDYPDLGDYHKAGCHRILSLGEDNFL